MFAVPIVQPDLRHEETIIQAAFALDCLQKTINIVFNRIDKRIEQNNAKVKELTDRIQKGQTKIKGLLSIRKAINLYAPAKFPAIHIFRDIPVTFIEGDPCLISAFNGNKNNLLKYTVHNKFDSGTMDLNNKLVFFHVQSKDETNVQPIKTERKKLDKNKISGLGSMPTNLRAVPSVLLFNTDIQVYGTDNQELKKVTLKHTKLYKQVRQQHQSSLSLQKRLLEPAPHSLAHRNMKFTPAGNLRYTPKLSQAPDLDLPMDLPDLPGIAGDLRYESQEDTQHIAPSSAWVIGNLPEFSKLDNNSDEDNKSTKIMQFEPRLSSPSTPAVLLNNSVTAVQIPSPPPPPPPPPISLPKTPSLGTSSINSRTELMEAIRNAGGIGKAPLRRTAASPLISCKNVRLSNTQPNSQCNSKGNGDLMADLHNKLLMRRKGISGVKDYLKNQQSLTSAIVGNPVISKLSSLIPPPSKGSVSDEDGKEDDDDTEWID